MEPCLRDGVPEAGEVDVAAGACGSGEFAAPATSGGGEERAGHRALQATVAALETQVRAARGQRTAGSFPAYAGRHRCRAGREEPVVAHRGHTDVEGAGRLGGWCARREEGPSCRRRGPARLHAVTTARCYGRPGRAPRAPAFTSRAFAPNTPAAEIGRASCRERV